ncbi:MAG: hypothetical protein FJW37_05440 [Acidobacteria bacterium]|nr:hypothetical protein [Acidobacteriota bacterium]
MRSNVIKGGSAREVEPVVWPKVFTNQQPGSEREKQQELAQRLGEARQAGFREAEEIATRRFESALSPLLERLARTIAELAELRSETLRRAEADLVKLALEISRRILHRELAADPAAIGDMIAAALRKLESEEIHRVRVHPDFEAPLRACLERLAPGRSIEIAGDPSLEAGGAVFELAHGILDASLETQLREIGRELGP